MRNSWRGDIGSANILTEHQTDKPASIISLFLSLLKLGLTAFGGPAMIAHIKELSVKHKGWLDENTFNDGVVLCQSIPGATAMQMAAYVGLRSQGIVGALASYIGFGLPAFILMLLLSKLYAGTHNLLGVVSLFHGLQVIVVAIVANATFAFGRTALKGYKTALMAAASAILFWKGVSPFIVIIGAGSIGAFFFKNAGSASVPMSRMRETGRTYRQIVTLCVILIGGLAALYVADKNLFHLAVLMLRIDLFAFGGGFASLPLLLHEIVDVRGWMDSKTFMDGIALGQVTPGPIVITSTFIGYLLYGLAGSVVATISIFAPSFLILTAAAPVFDRLKSTRYFSGTTKGILASFVGLLFYVTIKFTLDVPWDIIRAFLALAALSALVKKVDILYIVMTGAVVSLAVF